MPNVERAATAWTQRVWGRSWIRRVLIERQCWFVLGLAVLLGANRLRAAEPAPSNAPRKKADRAQAFFADPTVRQFQIELNDQAMNSLRRSPRADVNATVREGGQIYSNVAVHIKGMGSFRPLDEKPSFVIKFNSSNPKQEYWGISKLMLNNSVQDSTYVCEALSTRLFRDAGVPAARVTHASVTLNGRELGLYVAIEAMNKHFLKEHFLDTSGNLYDGYLCDINRPLHQGNGTDTSQNDVRKLFAACRVPDPSTRFQALGKVLDVDRFVSFAAMEMLIGHWDGYTLKANNYRCYHDPLTDRFVFIPYGMDIVFRRLNVPVSPPLKSIVSRALFETAEGRKLYEERLRALYTNVFQYSILTNRMASLTAKLRAAHPPGANLREMDRQASILRNRMALRMARIDAELSGQLPTPLEFDGTGLARIGDWHEEFDRGEPRMKRATFDGKNVLSIDAGGQRCRASWRTMVYLAPGMYSFEGMVQTEGPIDGYASLRISGDTKSLRVSGQSPWRPLQHNFFLAERGDVELVCELSTTNGLARFDLDSLRLRKRPSLEPLRDQ